MDDLDKPFESPKLLIDVQKTSIVDLNEAFKAFIRGNEYEIVQRYDPQTTYKTVSLRFKQRIPGPFRVKTSDILNNLRHALDQAVCDGAVQLGRAHAKGLFFPIGKSVDDLDAQFADKIRGVDPQLATFLRAFNAYYGGDDLLYAVAALAGPNKHRRILGMGLDSAGIEYSGYMRGDVRLGSGNWNERRNELEYARLGLTGRMKLDMTIPLAIVLGTGESPLTGPALTVLDKFASKVEGIVLGIEAETARILRGRTP